MKNQPDGPGYFFAVVLVVCIIFTVKFSRLPVIGFGESGLALGWLLIIDGVILLLASGAAIAAHVQSGNYVSIAEREDAARDAEVLAAWTPDDEPPDEYREPYNENWFDEWWNGLQQHYEDARARESWPSPVEFRPGSDGNLYGDLPGQPPRNPPPDDPPRPLPVPPTGSPDGVEAWIDEQFERVMIRKDGKNG
jgi:hypothetical protein